MSETVAMAWHIPRLILAWVIALISAVVVVAATPEALRFEWLTVLCGLNLVVTFVLQLGTAQRDGFITRVSMSAVGSLLILAMVQLVAFLTLQG